MKDCMEKMKKLNKFSTNAKTTHAPQLTYFINPNGNLTEETKSVT